MTFTDSIMTAISLYKLFFKKLQSEGWRDSLQVEEPTAHTVTHIKIDNNSTKLSSEFHTSEHMYTDTMKKKITSQNFKVKIMGLTNIL